MGFSEKQREIMRFPYRKYDALICDGAVRSGKTSIMSLSFFLWAMGNFNNCAFALCGKSVGAVERNIVMPLLSVTYLKDNFSICYNRGDHVIIAKRGKREDNQIEWYDKKSLHCQKCYKRIQFWEIIFAACIPLLAGYSTRCFIIPIIIGVLGVIITILESITKLYKYHENWIQYRSTCELLRYQKHLYLTGSSPYNNTDDTIDNLFVRNIEQIISSENNQWKMLQQEPVKKPELPDQSTSTRS